VTDNLVQLISRYRERGILIDTNLLLLFVIGSLDPSLIPKIARTANYTFNDFQIVSKFVDFFSTKVTTPHVLTETSNLIGHRINVRTALHSYIFLAEEKYERSLALAADERFASFGLADMAVIECARNNHLVFTDDRPLFGLLQSNGLPSVDLATLRRIIR
jgi:rRNA-processing protein FCF1